MPERNRAYKATGQEFRRHSSAIRKSKQSTTGARALPSLSLPQRLSAKAGLVAPSDGRLQRRHATPPLRRTRPQHVPALHPDLSHSGHSRVLPAPESRFPRAPERVGSRAVVGHGSRRRCRSRVVGRRREQQRPENDRQREEGREVQHGRERHRREGWRRRRRRGQRRRRSRALPCRRVGGRARRVRVVGPGRLSPMRRFRGLERLLGGTVGFFRSSASRNRWFTSCHGVGSGASRGRDGRERGRQLRDRLERRFEGLQRVIERFGSALHL